MRQGLELWAQCLDQAALILSGSIPKVRQLLTQGRAHPARASWDRSTESLSYQPGAAEPASPSTFPRKAPSFSRGRLRLLSLRSVEEPRSVPSIKERYPLLKHIINFMKDQTLTTVRYVSLSSTHWALEGLIVWLC